MPKRKVTPEVLGEMKNLKGEGLTYEEIAEKTGLSHPTVSEYMRKERLEGQREKAG